MAQWTIRVGQRAMAQVQSLQLRMIPETLHGAGCLNQVPLLLTRKGIDRVLVVTTPGFMKRGTLKPLFNSLRTRGIQTTVFSDVSPDPDFACAQKAAERYRSQACRGIIAIGGGSAIDCAKAAGALAVRPRTSARKLVGTLKVLRPTPFLVAVPTTAGTGSEVTAAAVLSDSATGRKYPLTDLALIPNVAVLDPQLLVDLPAQLTAYSGMDALTHAVEAFTNRYGSQESRNRALKAVVGIYRHLKPSFDDGHDLDHRMQMLWAAYDAGVAFTNARVGYVHALAHAVGGRYHIPHGLACAVLLPAVMEEFGPAAESQLAVLGRAIGLDGTEDTTLARAFIRSIRELAASMGIGSTFPELRRNDIHELAAAAAEEGNPAYPVPAIWDVPTFEKVLDAVCEQSPGEEPEQSDVSRQTRITQPGPLLDEMGSLAQRGWATELLLSHDRAAIKASPLRIKEWDYYLVNDDEYALAITVGDMGYLALASASIIDFKQGSFITQSTMGALPLGRLGMPATSSSGTVTFTDQRADIRYETAGGLRRLVVAFRDFDGHDTLTADVILDQQPRDSMVIATPWAEDPLAFYYNQKIVGMRAIGSFWLGGARHDFNDANSFGLLDWGRGVWTRDNSWFWSVAQGIQEGRRFAFNLGYGFGDTRAASENMLFVDGIAHKLGRVDFGIMEKNVKAAKVRDRYDLLRPWHITDGDGRLDLTFTPDIDRCDYVDLKAVVSDQHQVFGIFEGTVTLDDGTVMHIEGLRGSAEVVHNRY